MTTQAAAAGATRSVVLVVSMAQHPPDRVVELVRTLVARGDEVHLFTRGAQAWLESGIEPLPVIREAPRREVHYPVRRVERVLVYKLPGVVSRVGDRLAERWPGRWIGRLGAAVSERRRWVSGGIHHKLFYPRYAVLFRPLAMAWMFAPQLRGLAVDRVDRIIACDTLGIPLASRLAKRFPSATATTSLKLD
ncbi:hypothetical protein [Micromonospora sp. NPDC050495]|uniref:hypothetical protein n=1 Tax=Micromonospora sp. NPDC050495 TaxID=3154936 RepID=UPI003404BBC1